MYIAIHNNEAVLFPSYGDGERWLSARGISSFDDGGNLYEVVLPAKQHQFEFHVTTAKHGTEISTINNRDEATQRAYDTTLGLVADEEFTVKFMGVHDLWDDWASRNSYEYNRDSKKNLLSLLGEFLGRRAAE